MAESQLERAREDRAKLQREVTAMKREAEATWASERVENALLRERINDVAAEVARLTSVLEGPGSTDRHDPRSTRASQAANGAAKPRHAGGEHQQRGRQGQPRGSHPRLAGALVTAFLRDVIARAPSGRSCCGADRHRSRCARSPQAEDREDRQAPRRPSARPSPTPRSSTASSRSRSAPNCAWRRPRRPHPQVRRAGARLCRQPRQARPQRAGRRGRRGHQERASPTSTSR